MAAYILLGTFTDQGIRNVKDTTKRAEAVRAMGKKAGVAVEQLFWTLGQYDIAAILDAPDEEAATSLALSIGRGQRAHTAVARVQRRRNGLDRRPHGQVREPAASKNHGMITTSRKYENAKVSAGRSSSILAFSCFRPFVFS